MARGNENTHYVLWRVPKLGGEFIFLVNFNKLLFYELLVRYVTCAHGYCKI